MVESSTWAAEDCVNLSFLAAQSLALGIGGLERGLRRAAAEHGGLVQAIHRALRAELHVLRREPESLAARIQYRLCCANLSLRETERQLLFPSGLPSFSVRFSNEPRRELCTLTGHTQGIWRCAVTPDGLRAISASRDGSLRVWDLDRAEELRVLQRAPERAPGRRAESYELRDCAALDNERAVSACADGTLSIWDVTTGVRLNCLRGHEHRVLSCSLTPDRRHIVSGSTDRTVRVWDADSGAIRRVFSGHAAEVRRCLVTPDGERVVSVDRRGVVKVWELASARELARFRVPSLSANTFVLSPNGEQAVVADGEGGLDVWALDSCELVGSLVGHAHTGRPLAVTPDGRLLSSSQDGTVRVWDLRARTELACFELWEHFGHSDILLDCVVLPDGAQVLNASWDGRLTLWNLDELQGAGSVGQGTVGTEEPLALAATPDGKRMLGVNGEGTLQVFDTAAGQLLAVVPGAFAYRARRAWWQETPSRRLRQTGACRHWSLGRGRGSTPCAGKASARAPLRLHTRRRSRNGAERRFRVGLVLCNGRVACQVPVGARL